MVNTSQKIVFLLEFFAVPFAVPIGQYPGYRSFIGITHKPVGGYNNTIGTTNNTTKTTQNKQKYVDVYIYIYIYIDIDTIVHYYRTILIGQYYIYAIAIQILFRNHSRA